MICSKCGNNLTEFQQFCDKCGTPVTQGQVVQPQIVQQPVTEGPQMVAPGQAQPMQAQPVQPMQMPVEPMMQQPTMAPVQPMMNPVQPMAEPIQPTVGTINQAFQPQEVPQPTLGTLQDAQVVPQQQPVTYESMGVPQSLQHANPFAPLQQPVQQTPTVMVVEPAPAGPIKKEPPKKKAPLIITGCVALFALVAIVAVLLKPAEEIILAENGTRTIMVYLIGSDLESSQGSATFDIDEMLAADFDEEDVNLLIYTGGTKKWYTSEIEENENAIFEITGGKLVKKKSFDKQIMTKPGPLTDFLNYAYENYETDLYDLILWDHGGGPIYGYGLDENNIRNTSMSLDTLSDALSDSKLRKDRKLDFIGFDACLMGSLEVAYSLRNHANYLIASEEIEPGAGWNYDFLSNITKETETKDLGKDLIDQYFDYYDKAYYKGNLTLSMIDLGEVEDLIEEVDNLFTKADGEINVNNFSNYARKLTRKTVYGNTGRSASTYDLVDLLDLSNSISEDYPTEAENVERALNTAIVYSKDNMSNTNGISIYFPTNNKKNVDKILNAYNKVKISKDYYSFLQKYSSLITGEKLVNQSNYKSLKPTYTNAVVSVDLPDDLVNNYEKADYIIFRKLGENNYVPIYKSSNVTLEGSTLRAVPGNRQLIVDSPEGGEPGWTTMYEISRENGYTYYNVVAIVEKYDETLEEKLQLRNVNVIYRVKDGEDEGEIVDVQLMSTGDAASKTSLDLEQWQKIQFFSAAYKLYDENNEYLTEWESYKEYYINVFDIKEGFKLKFVGLDYDLSTIEIKDMDGNIIKNDNHEYYYMFRVQDTQGEIHQMNLVKAN